MRQRRQTWSSFSSTSSETATAKKDAVLLSGEPFSSSLLNEPLSEEMSNCTYQSLYLPMIMACSLFVFSTSRLSRVPVVICSILSHASVSFFTYDYMNLRFR